LRALKYGGPPRDVDAAIAVLREAIAAGVNHIDTSDYYGPHVTNQIIKKTLHPYPDDLVIVTKLGARRGEDKSWLHALSRQEPEGNEQYDHASVRDVTI
jgi:pyridoxine 4-dehydrogenase